jgi:uncharacterized protein (TIGR00730 family)
MLSSLNSLAVFCGSKSGSDPIYIDQAKKLGVYLAENDIHLVYGGARSGLMGAIASSCLSQGGKVTGVMPVSLEKKESIQPGLTQLIEVDSLQTRKCKMLSLSDGFIALPGGSGTLDEIFEVITLSQMGEHTKPSAFLNINDFYTPLISFLVKAKDQGFIHADYLDMLIVSSDIQNLIQQMQTFTHPHTRFNPS